VSEMSEERDWLLSRLEYDSPHKGLSSDALVRAVLTGREVPQHRYPLDSDDLVRCQYAVLTAPAHLKARAQDILDVFNESVRVRRNSVASAGQSSLGPSPESRP
jgi:hypothetical protein